MKTEKIIIGNKLIGEFMELKHDYANIFFDPAKCPNAVEIEKNYDSDWNDLMPVVEKIYKDTKGQIILFFPNWYCKWSEVKNPSSFFKKYNQSFLHHVYGKSSIEATWLAVVELIKWHNQQKH